MDDSDDGALDRFKTKIVIHSNGNIQWMAPKIVSSSCKFDVTYFPFDKQVNNRFSFDTTRVESGNSTFIKFRQLNKIFLGWPHRIGSKIPLYAIMKNVSMIYTRLFLSNKLGFHSNISCDC